MLETSPLLSNRYKRISSSNRPPSPSSSTTTNLTKSRRKSSITFLLALTAISAVVTYYYDTNLAPYEQVAKDGTTRFVPVNEDFLASVKLGSTVDEYGYRLSDEQRALARSMNVEKRVSYCYECCACAVLCVCVRVVCSYHVFIYYYDYANHTLPIQINTDHGNDQRCMARMHGPTYASRCM